MDEDELIAVCGLECSVCPLYNIPKDKKAADDMISLFRREKCLKEDEGLKEALERGMYCKSTFFLSNKIIEVILYNFSNIQLPQIYSQTEIRKTKMDELGLLMRIVSYLPI